MTTKELVLKWQDVHFFKFNELDLKFFNINEATIELLANTGLPEDAAPFLVFGPLHAERTIADIYGTSNPEDKFLIEIGFDGVGDTICVDTKNNCEVVACDHENNFKKRFMNSSVFELLYYLTIYKEFGEGLIRLRGADAFIESNFTDVEFDRLASQLGAVDARAVSPGSYWAQEIQNLLANRAYYKTGKRE